MKESITIEYGFSKIGLGEWGARASLNHVFLRLGRCSGACAAEIVEHEGIARVYRSLELVLF